MVDTAFSSFSFELLIHKTMKQVIAVILSAEVVKVGLQKAKMTKFTGKEPGTGKILSGLGNHICLIHNFQLYNLELVWSEIRGHRRSYIFPN